MHYTLPHSLGVDPRELLRQLMAQRNLTQNALSKATGGRTKQPQIHRFLEGQAKEPRRSTWEPVAKVLGIPVEALFDPAIATRVAKEKLSPGLADAAPLELREPPPQMARTSALSLDAAAVERLLRDLRAIPARRRSQLLDQIHQEAEFAREAYENLTSNPEPPAPKVPSAAARRRHADSGSGSRISVQVRHGDGNPLQGVLPLTTVADPFSAEPGERERALYDRIEASEKHPK